MQNIAWVTFLRHLPPELQDGLSVKTQGGTEVSIANIMRIDHEFFAFKGRLAGTQDTGRVFFVPYEQIDHLYYAKEVREEDFKTAFDCLRMPSPLETPSDWQAADSVEVEEETQLPEPEPAAVNRPAPQPIKSAVLERFRSRTSSSCNGTKPLPPQG